jgi:arsenate reductase (glutaredoxin)
MEKIIIYHNPKCTKSRCALNWLAESEKTVEIRDYLKIPLSTLELKNILDKLNLLPSDILRSKEKEYIDMVKGNYSSEEQLLDYMIKFPKLIERPIVLWEGGGVLARPLQNLIEKFNNE